MDKSSEMPPGNHENIEPMIGNAQRYVEKKEHIRFLSEQAYAEQIHQLVKDCSGFNNYDDKNTIVKSDDLGGCTIQRLSFDGDSFYWLSTIFVSPSNAIRYGKDFVQEEKERLYLKEAADIKAFNLERRTQAFSMVKGKFGVYQDLERTIDFLQYILITKIAEKDGKKVSLWGTTSDEKIENTVGYFVSASEQYPQSMKGAHIFLGFDRGSVLATLRKNGLLSLGNALANFPASFLKKPFKLQKNFQLLQQRDLSLELSFGNPDK